MASKRFRVGDSVIVVRDESITGLPVPRIVNQRAKVVREAIVPMASSQGELGWLVDIEIQSDWFGYPLQHGIPEDVLEPCPDEEDSRA
jgi:hypothetical protein